MDNYLDDYSSSELLKSTPSLVFLSSELIGVLAFAEFCGMISILIYLEEQYENTILS